MVEKQYQQTRRYLNETSNARHDFRQHILVIEEYLQSGEYDKLKEYIAPIYEDVNRSHKVICSNQAVDAIANHYDEVAKAKDITIYWNIKTSATLPIKESDMCAVIGNLVENAIQAATTLTGDDRIVNVRVGVLQEETLAIAVENAYRGTLTLDKNGLPISNKINHGIGLRSAYQKLYLSIRQSTRRLDLFLCAFCVMIHAVARQALHVCFSQSLKYLRMRSGYVVAFK